MKMTVPRNFAQASRWAVLAVLLLSSAAAIRTAGLQYTGVGGNDTILYYSLAEQWLAGNWVYRIGTSAEVFRPVLLAYNALALDLLGHADYSIKLANALLDSINVLLVAYLAWLFSGRWLVGVASGISYTLLPVAIWAARHELPHTLSTFFVLLAFIPALLAAVYRYRPLLFSGLSGLSLACATLTHQELVFIAAPIGLILLFLPRWWREGDTPIAAASRLGAFALLPVAAALLVLWHESAALRVLSEPAAVSTTQRVYLEVFARFLWNGLSGGGSLVFLVFYGGGFAVFFWKLTDWQRQESRQYCLSFLCCVGSLALFLALYAVFFNTVFVRGLLPLLALQLIAVCYSLAVACQVLGRVTSVALVLILSLVIGASNIGAYSAFKTANRAYSKNWDKPDIPTAETWTKGYRGFRADALYDPSYYSHWGNIHDALAGKIDEDNRLLILPSSVIFSSGRRPLQTEVYFGDNAIYRLDHTTLSLPEVVKQYNVRYVLFTLGQRRRVPTHHTRYLYGGLWAPPEPLDLASAYGMERYSSETEYYQLRQFINSVGARPLQLFPIGSFENQRAMLWMLP